jgi:signal transduction histidine kinase
MLDVVCRTTGMGFAAVARVAEGRLIACAVLDTINFGLQPGGELKVETTLRDEIRDSREPVIIDEVATDETYRSHPASAMYPFQSYISVPIVLPDGAFFGTLCAIDLNPATLKTPQVIGMFKLFAELIAFHIDASQRLAASEARLADERKTADLREQFIAILGHDLRNPLAAISAGTSLLLRTPLDTKAAHIVTLMQSSVTRMGQLIENVLDFARGRLGGGLPIYRESEAALEKNLREVIEESRTAWPDRPIEASFAVNAPVHCDSSRIGQLFSNLLGNALTHGSHAEPIRVSVGTANGLFELSVENGGDQIPDASMEQLFAPFSRSAARSEAQGLGLGLYIASEIARAHGGKITVASTDVATRFTFRMALH